MKTTTLWIIRIALTVQFLGVLAVPVALEAAETPRAMWMADWQRPQVAERTIGVLRMADSKLSFDEQGQTLWSLDLANVKKVAVVNGGRSLSIVSASGEEYDLTILDPTLMTMSPKKVVETISKAVQLITAISR